jgi:hypothetical protein
VGIGFNLIGRKIGEEINKFIQLVFEARKDDNRAALLYNSAGEDSVPLNDERIILVKVDGAGKYVAAGVLTPSQGAKPGEKIFFARNLNGDIVSKLSMLHDGHVDFTQDGNFTGNVKKSATITIGGDKNENVKGNTTEDVKGKAKYTSADTDIVSKAPVGINDGLYKTGLSPYLSAETSAATALQTAAAAAVPQLAILDMLSGAAGSISGLGAAINAFCAAIMAADTAAHTAVSKVVK